MSRYAKPLTPAQIAATKDEDIDFSDIPELDETFWRGAKLVEPDADHAAAVAGIETLMDAELGSEAFDRLETPTTLVGAYKARAHPVADPDPVDAILFRLEQLGDSRIEVSDYINVSGKLKELGCSRPEGIGILPEQFDTRTSTDKLAHLSRAHSIVQKLFVENHIPVSVIGREGQNFLRIHTASSEWVGPTLFVSAALLSENPHALSRALGVLANYLADFSKRPGEGKVRLGLVIERDGPKTCAEICYEGSVEGLTSLSETINQIFDEKQLPPSAEEA